MIVCALVLHSSFASGKSSDVMVSQPGLGNPLLTRIDSVILVVSVMLVVLATVNTIFITQATVLDAHDPPLWHAPSAPPPARSAPGWPWPN